MSEIGTSPNQPAKRGGRGVKIALALSLALNLAIVGLVAGVVLGADRGGERGAPPLRNLGIGPFIFALDRDGRDELRQQLDTNGPALRDERRAIGRTLRTVQEALLAEPFDRDAAEVALQQLREGATSLQLEGHNALLDQFEAMSAEDRAEVAARLDRVIRRGSPRRRD